MTSPKAVTWSLPILISSILLCTEVIHQYAWNNKTGDTNFSRFLSAFNYVIFDEYHLYDEAQIANILTLVKLREFFLKHEGAKKGKVHGVRFLFVSATPEEGLKKIFEEENMAYEEIIEEIVDDSTHARPIHGKIAVEFVGQQRYILADK